MFCSATHGLKLDEAWGTATTAAAKARAAAMAFILITFGSDEGRVSENGKKLNIRIQKAAQETLSHRERR